MYFIVTVYNFPFLCACLPVICHCVFFHIWNECVIVQNSYMFMLWLLFQISTNPSNQSRCRIHLLMLYIDGLSFFLLYHQTNNILIATKCYLAFVEFHLQIVMWFKKSLWLHSPMYACFVSTTHTYEFYFVCVSDPDKNLWEIPL